MRILAALVFDKMIGCGHLADIVIQSAHAREYGVGANRATGVFSQLAHGVRVLIRAGSTQGELTELWDGIGGEELGAAIHGMNWLPSTRFSRVAAGEVSVDGLQPRHDRREIRGRQ